MELSLCCKFHEEKISFRIYTLKNIKSLPVTEARNKILDVVYHNIDSLSKSFDYCRLNGIKGFRIASDIIPHHTNLLSLDLLNQSDLDNFRKKLEKINTKGLILSMHPGQFVNMGSPTEEVVLNSIKELKEHIFIAKSLGFYDINFHLGGTYGNKSLAIDNFIQNMKKYFSKEELNFFTLENDEFNYSIEDVVKVCKELNIPAVFDIHHQRVYNNKFNLNENFENQFLEARKTWENKNYQRIHISSPKNGFENIKDSRAHADYIDINHLPKFLWSYNDLLIDVEAKHKELAVLKLYKEIQEVLV